MQPSIKLVSTCELKSFAIDLAFHHSEDQKMDISTCRSLPTSLNVLVNRMVIMYKIGWHCAQFDNSMILFIPGQNDPKSR